MKEELYLESLYIFPLVIPTVIAILTQMMHISQLLVKYKYIILAFLSFINS